MTRDLASCVNVNFTLQVKATDSDGPLGSNKGNVTISIVDENSEPNLRNRRVTVAEDAEEGTLLITLNATDPDPGDTLTYYIQTSKTVPFELDSASGDLTVSSLGLDYETDSEYALTIVVQDDGHGKLQTTATVTVIVTDVPEPPSLPVPSSQLSLPENSPVG